MEKYRIYYIIYNLLCISYIYSVKKMFNDNSYLENKEHDVDNIQYLNISIQDKG